MRKVGHQRRPGPGSGPGSGCRRASLAPGFAQANLIVLPLDAAGEFELFARSNPRPCPLLDVTEPGRPSTEALVRHAAAAAAATDVGDERGQANALLCLGEAQHHLVGDYPRASWPRITPGPSRT